MIEPSQTLCTCTTRCFKNCILPSIYSSTATTQSRRRFDDLAHQHSQNIAFCKLGCASTSCSALSTISNPSKHSNWTVDLTICHVFSICRVFLDECLCLQMGRMWKAVLAPALTSASRRTHQHHRPLSLCRPGPEILKLLVESSPFLVIFQFLCVLSPSCHASSFLCGSVIRTW